MYLPPEAREPIWIRTGRGSVVDLRDVSSFSLSTKETAASKHLLFVWDREAMNVLSEQLEKYLPMPDVILDELEQEGW
jgi:hypothetical protein